jgi:hypothetical protein
MTRIGQVGRHVVTAIVMLTAPLWIIPFCIFMILALLYASIHDSIWGKRPKGGGGAGVV